MGSDFDDIEAALTGLPPATQRLVTRMLDDWGSFPDGADSFPVRMMLVSRLMLWCHAKLTKDMLHERIALTEASNDVLTSVARQSEVQEIFLRDLDKSLSGQRERILAQSSALERAQETFTSTANVLAARLPTPEAFTKMFPGILQPQTGGRETPTADLLDLLARLLETADRLDDAVLTASSHTSKPALPDSAAPQNSHKRQAQALTFFVFTSLTQLVLCFCFGGVTLSIVCLGLFVGFTYTLVYLFLSAPARQTGVP